MPQPNQGKPAPSAPTAAPMEDKKGASKDASVHFGYQPGGTKGSK
jgi:hypothetical protein